jgi:hypothetical protein
MTMALDHSCQVQRHSYAERGHDLYETPEPAITTLIKAEPLLQQPCDLWDPCCGKHGNIARVLRSAGHQVLATDLVDYGLPFTAPAYFNVDFLLEHKLPGRH